ncbi:MAG: hypothetical protein HC892_10365 [Saprospiraceae bacterium]|nr:hypothetical protein [Saprospiraceae bacterium]
MSLFFSNVEQVEQVNYEDFKFQFSEERVHAAPSLIFEKLIPMNRLSCVSGSPCQK